MVPHLSRGWTGHLADRALSWWADMPFGLTQLSSFWGGVCNERGLSAWEEGLSYRQVEKAICIGNATDGASNMARTDVFQH